MISFLVEDWKTVRVELTQDSFTQAKDGWVDLAAYKDVSLWLDTRSVNAAGASNVLLFLQTAPEPEDELFKEMDIFTMDATPSSNPMVANVILARSPTLPLARWLRWKLFIDGTPAASWGACFRLFASAMPVGSV